MTELVDIILLALTPLLVLELIATFPPKAPRS